jgi:transcriptional regulator with GAF, ATPase, and Fis domain
VNGLCKGTRTPFAKAFTMTPVREHPLTALAGLCSTIRTALDLDAALAEVLRTLARTTAMQQAAVILAGEDGADPRFAALRASWGLPEGQAGAVGLGAAAHGRVIHAARAFVVRDLLAGPLFVDELPNRGPDKGEIFFMGVPIVLHGQAEGVLTADRLFAEEVSFKQDIRVMNVVAALIAQLIALNRQAQELEARVQQLSIMLEGGSADCDDLPPSARRSGRQEPQRPPGLVLLKDIEKHEVVAALERNGWVQSRAARELGITLRQMGYRVKKFGLASLVAERRRQAKAR